MTREELLYAGTQHITKWCKLNAVSIPEIRVRNDDPHFDVCAYYRSVRYHKIQQAEATIHIWPARCAHIGNGVRAWSYPGYITDRTPYGVLAHELGHHVDEADGLRPGRLSGLWRKETGDKQLTSYADNDNEWFAEIFRLFVTNPQLLWKLRPRVFDKLQTQWSHFAETRQWEVVLEGAEPWLRAAQNKIAQSERSHSNDAKAQDLFT